MLSNPEICELCYEVFDPALYTFTCLLCPSTKTKKIKCNSASAGYNNLTSHLSNIHGDSWVEFIHSINIRRNANLKQSTIPRDFVKVDSKSKNLYDWIDLVASLDVPLSWCENPKFLKACKFEKVSLPTLRNTMIEVGLEIEKEFKIWVRDENNVVKPLVMMTDMWDDGAGHKQLGVFLLTPNQTFEQAEFFLLCLTPLLDESTSDGDSQIDTISEALGRVGLTWDDILLFEADNTSVNPSIARKQVF